MLKKNVKCIMFIYNQLKIPLVSHQIKEVKKIIKKIAVFAFYRSPCVPQYFIKNTQSYKT